MTSSVVNIMNSMDILMIVSKLWLATLLWMPVAGAILNICEDIIPNASININRRLQQRILLGPIVIATMLSLLSLIYCVLSM